MRDRVIILGSLIAVAALLLSGCAGGERVPSPLLTRSIEEFDNAQAREELRGGSYAQIEAKDAAARLYDDIRRAISRHHWGVISVRREDLPTTQPIDFQNLSPAIRAQAMLPSNLQ